MYCQIKRDKIMEKKALKDLVIGDKVYIVTNDGYEVAELGSRAVVNGEKYDLVFEVCGSGDEVMAVGFDFEMDDTSIFTVDEDWQLDKLITTDKEEVIAYYKDIINVCNKIIEEVKEGNKVVEEY